MFFAMTHAGGAVTDTWNITLTSSSIPAADVLHKFDDLDPPTMVTNAFRDQLNSEGGPTGFGVSLGVWVEWNVDRCLSCLKQGDRH